MDPTTITQYLGLTPEQSAAIITIGALSTSFYFVMGFLTAPFNTLKTWVYNYFVREINLHISEPDYNKVNLWLEMNKEHIKLQRSYKVITAAGKSDPDDYDYPEDGGKKKSPNRLVAGFGNIIVMAPGHPIMLINRKKEESKQIYQQTEAMTIRFITLKPQRIIEFFNEVTNIQENDGPFVFDADSRYWSMRGEPKPVSQPVGAGARQMIASVERFITSKPEYDKRLLQFKRGYLLYGEPGTGKTSILSYIAQKHGMHLYTMNSESILKIQSLSSGIKPNSIVIIEDIDLSIVGNGRTSSNDSDDEEGEGPAITNKEALNNFLNALDGVVEFNASIIVATSNNPGALDSALLRPGRIDETIEVGLLTSDDQIEHVNNFFGVFVDSDGYDLPHRTFAELQLICTTHMMNVNDAMTALHEDRSNNKHLKSHI